jgi:hypothetical protein
MLLLLAVVAMATIGWIIVNNTKKSKTEDITPNPDPIPTPTCAKLGDTCTETSGCCPGLLCVDINEQGFGTCAPIPVPGKVSKV